MGQGEDRADIVGGQKIPAARFQPAVARIGLALRAVAVPAGVERDGAMPATGTLIHMGAERGGSTAQDGGEHLQMQPGEPFPAALEEGVSRGADHIGHLDRWPGHLFRLG
jgi:hypothetical protein